MGKSSKCDSKGVTRVTYFASESEARHKRVPFYYRYDQLILPPSVPHSQNEGDEFPNPGT